MKFFNPRSIKDLVSPDEFYRCELGSRLQPRGDWCCGGLCPFHPDRVAGTFRINVNTGSFICFSCGAKGGDIIAFLRLRDSATFTEALNYLADAYGDE